MGFKEILPSEIEKESFRIIRKELAEDVVKRLGLDKTDYPYKEALDMIDGDFFWIIAWDD